MTELQQGLVEAFAGAQGSVVAISLTLPIESVQKASALAKDKTIGQIIKELMAKGGLARFWQGWSVLIFQVFYEKFMFFLGYTMIKRYWMRLFGALGPVSNVLLGYTADILIQPVNYPPQIITGVLQTADEPLTLSQAVSKIYNKDGLAGFYNGVQAQFGLALKPAISNAVFDQMKDSYLGSSVTNLTFFEGFGLGAIGRIVATMCTYPYLRARILASAGKGGTGNPLSMIAKQIQEGGAASLYSGFIPELVRGVTFQGINMACKEELMAVNMAYFLPSKK